MKKFGIAAAAVFACLIGISAPIASADAWTDGQVQWENCKDSVHSDGYCHQLLNGHGPHAPAPAPAPTGSAG
ncbi:hypothetical protein KO481_26855 [Nocardia sp. NEAU-G5]|uniref:Uncharacterized protein n=1 Tax=Nocardia albiluteola TaxID=2842303 RepID=A0ABS6B4B8_9NOCA|nr:hypothetical protein [Nocardia albiluteola]MBU3065136.1 hypothetical protein [Nocardia albiluteola]